MNHLKKQILVSSNHTIQQALRILHKTGLKIVLIVDPKKKLLGVATDGDIRRALLKKYSLDTPISRIANRRPIIIKEGFTKNQALRLFSEKINQIPVINKRGQVTDLLPYAEFCNTPADKKEIVVRAKAPLRISFSGGGTDVNPYIEAKGGVVLSTTINKYCFGTLKKRSDSRITIYSKDYDLKLEIDSLKSIKYNGKLDLLKAVIRLMQPNFGMDLYFQSNVPPGSGLGGSATIASVAAGLINHLREDKLDEYQLAEIAFQAERVELGIAGGWQDQYAAVFGGFNFIEFKKDDVIVHPLKIKEDILNELESSLLLCFTGQTRNSGDIVKAQTKAFVSKNKAVTQALHKTRNIAINMKNVLLKGDLLSFGSLFDEAWSVKKEFTRDVSNKSIDRLYKTGKDAGAIGGKILGAGGGGYLLFFCPPLAKFKIASALQAKGGKTVDFNFDFRGLQTWTARESNGS